MNQSALNGMIRKHKEHIIWVAVFLVLAVFVTALVFGTLKRSVQAQTYTKRVFACSYAQEGAEPVAHQHNDDCYENGELICTLPERELHIHGDECYAEERVLTCTLEEGEGHVHTDACYTEKPVLICTLEESDGHVHSVEAGCYTRVQGDLICTNEDPEHVHTDDCYAWEEVLTCEIPEGEGAHHHSEECYETQRVLSCGKEEGEGAHTHDDTCYEINKVLICDKEEVKTEHVHTVDCFKVVDMSPEEIHALHMSELPESDPDADVESPDVWESRFASVPLSGNWDKDLLKIAETQLGYTESQRNFDAVLDENGDGYTLKGWTRYGAWYGIPYGDWCAMFISFCLNYADIPESAIPYDCATTTWIDSLSDRGMYASAGSYDPKPGDLIFFDWEGDGRSDHVGIVWAVNPNSITTIEGNHTISVELFDYDLSDGHIQGYGILPENPALAVTESEENESGENKNQDEVEGGAASASGASDSTDPSNNNVDTENTEKTELDPETLAKMPPFSYSERVAGIRVSIEADAGAFPEGTTVEIKAIEDDGLAEQVAPVVNGKVVQIQAVDITFYDAEGNEIEPLIPIRVTMRPNTETDEANGVEVVHVDSEGNVNAVTPDAGITQPDKGAAFDADSFSPYVLVYVLKFDYPVNGKTYESELAGGEDLLLSDLLVQLGVCEEEEISEFVSKIASVTASDPEALSVSEKDGVWTVRPMKDSEGELSLAIEMQDGAKFSVAVQATGKTEVSSEDNNTVITAVNDLYLPENAVAETAVLTEEESTDAIAAVEKAVEQEAPEAAAAPAAEAEGETPTVSQVAYQVFSISLDGVEYSKYEDGFQVSLTLPEGIAGKDFEVYHIDNDGNAQKLEIETDAHNLTEETQLVSTVSFVTPSFSDFVIRYTVDFHYKVNGNYYEFSFTGGSFVSLEKLVELLQIAYEPEIEPEPKPAMVGESIDESSDIIGNADNDNVVPDSNMNDTSGSADPSSAAISEQDETRLVIDNLAGIEVSSATKDFVSNIESVTFSDPTLIWVGKVEADTTVGAIKETNHLTPEYSAELTEEQIAAIDDETVNAGDWALISLEPFKTEQTLVIIMNDNKVYTIRVTDEWTNPYCVRILLDQNAKSVIQSENVYVFITAQYTGYEAYQGCLLDITENDIQKGYDDYVFYNWKDGDFSNTSGSFGDQVSIDIKLVKPEGNLRAAELYKALIVTEGNVIKNYKIHYNAEAEARDGAITYSHIDYIKFETIDAQHDYDTGSILGPSINYGIVAEHLSQENHLQTTFAVNHYTGKNDYGVTPNLSGSHSGSIVVAEYNTRDDTKENAVGAVITGNNTQGQIKVDSIVDNGNLVLYIDNDSGAGTTEDIGSSNGKIYLKGNSNKDNTAWFEKSTEVLSRDFVNPCLTYGSSISSDLASMTVTFDPPIPPRTENNEVNSLTIDTRAFTDDATIYIDALRILEYIGKTGALTINKDPDQIIVFNFKNTDKYTFSDVTINKFTVNGVSTQPDQNPGRVNENLDNIARHIVWNLYDVVGETTINTSCGIFLQRNSNSKIRIEGTSTGWIVSKGLVYNDTAEWHNSYSDMPDNNTVQLHAQKTVELQIPSSQQQFYFSLEEYNGNNNWGDPIDQKTNSYGSIDFNTITYTNNDSLRTGWHIYRISENQNKPESTVGSYNMDNSIYYAAVYVQKTIDGNHVIAHPPIYYDQNLDYVALYNNPSGEYPTEHRLPNTLPSFNNIPITDTARVKATKTFVNAPDEIYSKFKITASWPAVNPTNTVDLMTTGNDVINLPDGVTVTRTGGTGGQPYEWVISNLANGTQVKFEEKDYGVADGSYNVEVTVNSSVVAAGDTPSATIEAITSDPANVVSFVNSYTQNSQLEITIVKVDDNEKPLGDSDIGYATFELHYKKNKSDSFSLVRRSDNAEYKSWLGADDKFKVPGNAAGLKITGLVDGIYQVVETDAPKGYVISNATPVTFTVVEGKVLDENDSDMELINAKYNKNTKTFTITNHIGVELPNSGGPGTALYGLIGGLMVVTAGAVLTLRKKKNKA